MLVWNLVSDFKGGTQTESAWEQGAGENIWTEEKWSNRMYEGKSISKLQIDTELK
jgi:hypothetical protein